MCRNTILASSCVLAQDFTARHCVRISGHKMQYRNVSFLRSDTRFHRNTLCQSILTQNSIQERKFLALWHKVSQVRFRLVPSQNSPHFSCFDCGFVQDLGVKLRATSALCSVQFSIALLPTRATCLRGTPTGVPSGNETLPPRNTRTFRNEIT